MPVKKKILEKALRRGPSLVHLILFGLLAGSTSQALAHRVYIYAWVDGDQIYTESYFGSNKRVKGGLVMVYGPSNEKLLEGRTSEEGEFAFQVPQKTDLRIVLEATMGHRGEYLLKADEFSDTSAPGNRSEQISTEITLPEGRTAQSRSRSEEIQMIVEKALDDRLRPIIRELVKLREEKKGPGLTEIIGGIGYVFGFMGLIMYFRTRRAR